MNATEKRKKSRTGNRRFNNKVVDLKAALSQGEARFLNVWGKMVNGWITEIHYRARVWSNGKEFRNSTDRNDLVKEERQIIFGVVEIAERLLAECGDNAEHLVGQETRQILDNECVRAVARVSGKSLNSGMTQHWYRWAKD